MVPDAFTGFFAASAGVAGALIGLLFVAVSVNPAWTDADPAHRLDLDVRAGVAFSALSDALVVALFALVPGVNLGTVAIVVATVALASCLALALTLARAPAVAHRHRKLRLIAGQSLVFALQLSAGVQLAGDPRDSGAVRNLAMLTVVLFLVGIARAWQLIGARDSGLVRAVGEAVRDQRQAHRAGASAGGADHAGAQADVTPAQGAGTPAGEGHEGSGGPSAP